jgi:hypothetical protein
MSRCHAMWENARRNRPNLRLRRFVTPMVVLLGAVFLSSLSASAEAAGWTVTPSFHTISLYYGPFATGNDPVKIQYRKSGSTTWKNAQDLFIDRSVPGSLPQYQNQYRGSIVNVAVNTQYDLRYQMSGGEWTQLPSTTTRSATFTGTSALFTGSRTTKLVITEGGSPGNWKIYNGQNNTIDLDHTDNCVEINAPYVILENFIIKDCKFQAIVATKSHIIIANNDISDWGAQEYYYPSNGKGFTGSHLLSSPQNTCISGTSKLSLGRADDAAILLSGPPDRGDREDIVIQRNTIHDPRYRSTRWEECTSNEHPWGSRAINAANSKRLVIRYNNIFAKNDRNNGASGLDRDSNRYYDAVYISSSQDVDVYANIIRNATDDLIESDNYAVNVRIFGNYFDNSLDAISHQAMQAGPSYIFRNVFDRGAGADDADYVGISPKHWAAVSGRALKISLDNGNPAAAMFNGPLFVIHNTMLRTNSSGFKLAWGITPGAADKWQHDINYVTSMNNVFMTSTYYVRDEQADSDYKKYVFADLHNMPVYTNPTVNYALTGTCASGGNCVATASWLPGHGPMAGSAAATTPTGLYKIGNANSDGAPIDNFNGAGNRTRGAQGSVAAMQYGPDAHWLAGVID